MSWLTCPVLRRGHMGQPLCKALTHGGFCVARPAQLRGEFLLLKFTSQSTSEFGNAAYREALQLPSLAMSSSTTSLMPCFSETCTTPAPPTNMPILMN